LTSDLGLADASAVQFPDFRGVNGRGRRATQPLAVLPRMSQARSGPFPQYFAFEFSENCKQASHGATGWGRQVQCFG
jgi:hypothetical protein